MCHREKGGMSLELIEDYLCGILEKYCEDENCDKEELSGIRAIGIVESIWSEIENLRPDIANKLGRDEIEKCAGYTLFLDNETAVILIDKVFYFDSIRKNFCWIEVLIHEITHYRDFKSHLGIFGNNTYDSMLKCYPFWYWAEFHARYKGTLHMLNYVNRMPDDTRKKYETDMMERLDDEIVFIISDADKKMRCYHFMHLLGDIAAYNEKGFKIQSEPIKKFFPDYLDYIDFLKSKNQTVDINFFTVLQYHLEKNIP